MWTAILGIIGPVITTLLPFLAKLILYIIDKKMENDQMKKDFLKFLSDYETDIPVKLHDKYNEQIERIRAELKKESGDVK